MAHFIGTLQGCRGEASRLGSMDSGIEASVQGWDVGIYAVCRHNRKTGVDTCTAYTTGGSNGQNVKEQRITVQHPQLENPKWKWDEVE